MHALQVPDTRQAVTLDPLLQLSNTAVGNPG